MQIEKVRSMVQLVVLKPALIPCEFRRNISGTGTANQFTYWTAGTSIGSTNYLVRNSNINNLGSMGSGRVTVNNPFEFSAVGEHLIQNSSSGQSIYGIGLQTSNNYLRTSANFAFYYSGSHVNRSALPGEDVIWESGKSGWGFWE
jgi:hypothetical protein